MQFTHVYSQKSTRTTLPRRSSGWSGLEFAQRSAMKRGIAAPTCGKGVAGAGVGRALAEPQAARTIARRARIPDPTAAAPARLPAKDTDRLPRAFVDHGVEEAAIGAPVRRVEGDVAGQPGDRRARADRGERRRHRRAVARPGLDGAAEEERRVVGVGVEPGGIVAVREAE